MSVVNDWLPPDPNPFDPVTERDEWLLHRVVWPGCLSEEMFERHAGRSLTTEEQESIQSIQKGRVERA